MNNRASDTFHLEKFFEYSPDMLCIGGTDRYRKQVNAAFERTLGWATEELLSTPFLDFVHVEDVEAENTPPSSSPFLNPPHPLRRDGDTHRFLRSQPWPPSI